MKRTLSITVVFLFLFFNGLTFTLNAATPLPLIVDGSDRLPQTIFPSFAPGDSLPRIILPAGYTAYVHATGLTSPDGLALSPDGILYVVEESPGRVSAVSEDGTITLFASGFTSPEGIAFDTGGNLYVAEDAENGRVIQIDTLGAQTVIVTNRDAPEGVTVEADGSVLITESNVQFIGNPFLYETHVTRIPPGEGPTNLNTGLLLWSYSGISTDATGMVYVCNEASGTGTTNSVFTIDPASGSRTLFCSSLIACEGLRFSPGGVFPLYVAEEDLGDGHGRLSSVDASGTPSTFATGFFTIEDVLVDEAGRIFVTEDATGMIIRIEDTTSIGITETKVPERMDMIVFPNPCNGIINFRVAVLERDYDPFLRENTQVSIFDISGKLVLSMPNQSGRLVSGVFSKLHSKDACLYRWQPDAGVASGVYFINVRYGNLRVSRRVLYLK